MTQTEIGSTTDATNNDPALSVRDLWKVFGPKSDKVFRAINAALEIGRCSRSRTAAVSDRRTNGVIAKALKNEIQSARSARSAPPMK